MKLGMPCAVLLVILAASGCLAEPFLISDPYPAKDPQPTKFVVTVDGKSSTAAPHRNADGSLVLKYDLGGLPDGTHTIVIKALNDAQALESGEITYTFNKMGSRISGLKVKEEKQKIAPSRSLGGYVRP
jgi:hypothetical protein